MGRLWKGWRWYRTVPAWKWPNCHGSENIPPLWVQSWFGLDMGQASDLERPQQRFPILSPSFCSAADFKLRLCPLPPSETWTWLPTWSCLVTGGFVWRSGLSWPWALSPDLLCPLAQTPLERALASEDAAPACLVVTLSTGLVWAYRAASLCWYPVLILPLQVEMEIVLMTAATLGKRLISSGYPFLLMIAGNIPKESAYVNIEYSNLYQITAHLFQTAACSHIDCFDVHYINSVLHIFSFCEQC